MADLPPIVVELKAKAGEFLAAMGEVDKKIAKTATEGEANMKRLNAAASAVALGLGGAFAIIGKQSVEAADKFENAHVRLEQAIKNTGGSIDTWSKQIGATDTKMRALGYTNAQTEQALGTLTTATGSVSKAMGEMGTAADLAAFKHIDLNDASVMLNKAMAGNSRALKDLGINMTVPVMTAAKMQKAEESLTVAEQTYQVALERTQAKHKITQADVDTLRIAKEKLTYQESQLNEAMKAQSAVLDAVNAKVGGQASAAANTMSGHLKTLNADANNLEQGIGHALVPILDDLVKKTEDVVNWIGKHEQATKDLVYAAGVLLVAALGVKLVGAINSMINAAKDIGTAFKWVGDKIAAWAATSEAEQAAVAASAEASAATAQSAYLASFGNIEAGAAAMASAVEADMAAISTTAATEGAAAGAGWLASFKNAIGPIGLTFFGLELSGQIPGVQSINQMQAGDKGITISGGKAYKNGQPYDIYTGQYIGGGSAAVPTVTGPSGTMSATTLSSINRIAGPNLPSNFASQIYDAVKAKNPLAVAPQVPISAGGGGGGTTRRGRSAGTPVDAFAQALAGFANIVGGENINTPTTVGAANREVGIDQAILRHAELYEKQGQSLVKAAKGAQNKARAINDLHRSQSLVNTALRNLHTAEAQQKTLQEQAIRDAITLANAKLEAGANVADPIAMARLKVQEAQNTLSGDKAGSLAYFQDLYALHVAENDLKNAIDQNTNATNVNTQAMVQPFVGSVPSYLAVRAGANAGAYVGSSRGSAGGIGTVNITVVAPTGTIPDGTLNQMVTALNRYQRRNGGTPLF